MSLCVHSTRDRRVNHTSRWSLYQSSLSKAISQCGLFREIAWHLYKDEVAGGLQTETCKHRCRKARTAVFVKAFFYDPSSCKDNTSCPAPIADSVHSGSTHIITRARGAPATLTSHMMLCWSFYPREVMSSSLLVTTCSHIASAAFEERVMR